MSPSPAKTIHDIARLSGVSASTVSRALRNDRRISVATKTRVTAVADKVGYVPNPLISTLMAHLRTTKPVEFQSMIAYLDTSLHPSQTNSWVSSRLHTEAVRTHAARLGYTIDDFWYHDPEISPAKLIKIFKNRGILGIIVHYVPRQFEISHALSLDLGSFAVASLGAKLDEPFIHYACTDHFVVMQQALVELQKLGYRRIGLALDSYTNNVVENRFFGAYVGWQAAQPEGERVPYLLTEDFSFAHFSDWYKCQQPDAIICIDAEVLAWLKKMKVAVPKEVGVVHLDIDGDHQNLAGIRQNHEAAAAAAVDLITGQLNRNERGIPADPKAVLLGGTWVAGRTVRRQKSQPRQSHRAAPARRG